MFVHGVSDVLNSVHYKFIYWKDPINELLISERTELLIDSHRLNVLRDRSQSVNVPGRRIRGVREHLANDLWPFFYQSEATSHCGI
jgi:hypothetical protein